MDYFFSLNYNCQEIYMMEKKGMKKRKEDMDRGFEVNMTD